MAIPSAKRPIINNTANISVILNDSFQKMYGPNMGENR
jgi:hypothetical protein